MSNILALLWKNTQEILSSFFIPPQFLLVSIHPSIHHCFTQTIKSTCQFLRMRLEEMRALSMHHLGAAAGCPNTCQSGGAFLIITHTQLRTHPDTSRCTPTRRSFSYMHTATHSSFLEGLSMGFRWPFSISFLYRLLGGECDSWLQDTHYALQSLPPTTM